jgi:hypothetical protein
MNGELFPPFNNCIFINPRTKWIDDRTNMINMFVQNSYIL